MKPIIHLTQEEHLKAAELLSQVQDTLAEVARLVHRAPYTDCFLDIAGAVQEFLIDPLKEGWDLRRHEPPYLPNPYLSVGYFSRVSKVRRRVRKAAREEALAGKRT